MRHIDRLAAVLLVVGGLHWGLVAIADLDLVAAIPGPGTLTARLVYGLAGLAAVYQVTTIRLMQRRWNAATQAAG